jgi:Trypsin-like peptidase domain
MSNYLTITKRITYNLFALILACTGSPQSTVYAQQINSYESYKLYCSDKAYAYNLQSPECDRYKLTYQQQIKSENSKKVSLSNFKSIKIEDWRSPDPDVPWSEIVFVSSDFDSYYAVFDKNYRKSGGWFSPGRETGVISKWTPEQLSIFIYKKSGCDAILGCSDRDIIPIGDSVEVLVGEKVFKIHGEDGNFSLPNSLLLALQKVNDSTTVKLRINKSLINDIGSKTIANLSTLYSINEGEQNQDNIYVDKIALVEALPEGANIQKIVSYSTPSVVKIENNSGSGTGFIISETGLILTNKHVVSGDKSATVTLYDGTKIEAKILKKDKVADIALLKIDVSSSKMKALPVCYAQYPSVGEEVVVIGNPLSLNTTVTRGIVSGLRQDENQSLIQTDAPVNPGNSGGPLLNQRGEVLGIVSAKMSGMGIEGLGFAIPISQVVDNLGIQLDIPQNQALNHCGNPVITVSAK